MHFRLPFAVVFNPTWLIIVQTILALILVWNTVAFSWAYTVLVLSPAILYLIYAFLWKSLYREPCISAHSHFGPAVRGFSAFLILLVSIGNVFIIYQLVNLYGGVSGAIHNFGSIPAVTAIQRNAPPSIGLLITLNYLLPVVIVPLVLHMRLRSLIVLLFIPLLLLFLVTSLYGARVLLFDMILSLIITRSLLFPFRTRFLATLLVLGFAMLLGLASLQAARNNSNLQRGFEELGRYYSVSLNNGATIISHDRTAQPLYWTLRFTFYVPVISNVLGTQTVYEGIFGKVPIRSRKDDFNYAANLGVDPRYNTFGIYGYSFLDLGMWGMFILLFSYLFVYYIYRLYISSNSFGLLLYPGMYILLFDQLRTNSIFSIRSAYFVIIAVVIVVFNVLINFAAQKRKVGEKHLLTRS